jgi:undecaprenyl-diphosphatase
MAIFLSMVAFYSKIIKKGKFMTVLQSIILGIVQGITEFVPISSSGHLILIQNLFGLKEATLSFDVALHLGTFLALILFFWRDWWRLLEAFFRSLRHWDWKNDLDQRLFYLLVIASIPGALFSALLEKQAETVFRSSYLILINFVIIGVLFLIVEKVAKKLRELKQTNIKDAIVIGLSQTLAIIPGVSRSGITITAGLFSGMKRESATRFSFLMATPIILGAGLFSLTKIISQGEHGIGWTSLISGFLAAAIVGFLAIKYLLIYLKNHTLDIFAYYRFLVAAVVIIYLLMVH